MAGAGEENHLLIELFDGAVEVSINECEAGGGAPVSEEAIFDVFGEEGFFEQGVLLEVDHAEGEVVAGGPVGVGVL